VNHFVIVVLDSLRWDTSQEAAMTNAARLGTMEQRWSYASWTAPSHYNLLTGLLPHTNPTNVYASDHYKADFARYSERLDVPDIEFRSFLPHLSLPRYLRDTLGYRTQAFVSMPVLNPATGINNGFDEFELMPTHNDMRAILPRLRFDTDKPTFALLNVGETHYPYALPDEDPSEWPRVSGLHGVLKHLDEQDDDGPSTFFDTEALVRLRDRQVRAAAYLDGVLADLYDLVPAGTWIIVTSDHGELFGEGGWFGHGPIVHDKVFEVPFVEGRIR
jgi:arylsulfatase A-like enzyme